MHGRKTNTVKARFEYDNYYVDNLSFGLDFKIFFMTIKSVFTNEGNEDDGSSEVEAKPENEQTVAEETVAEEAPVLEEAALAENAAETENAEENADESPTTEMEG